MGIIVTTIIMTVSCVIHNNNLSDEEIIEKAMALGMVMPDSEQESEAGLYELVIQLGDTPQIVADELYKNGMVENASEFRKYLEDNGYSEKLRSGSYTITKDMNYEEIAKLITKTLAN